MRKRLYEIVEKAKRHDTLSMIYDGTIIAAALLSMLPLTVKTEPGWMYTIELYSVYILFADYVFHWMTADYAEDLEDASFEERKKAFIRYPFTLTALLNLISLLPTLGVLSPSFLVLRLLRLTTLAHYSNSLTYVGSIFRKEKRTLLAVLYLAILYIFVSALVMFSFEPQSFTDFFEALYWATTALTTVGYGDVSPVTWVGRLVSMISSLFGIAVIALPAGIVTADFVSMVRSQESKEKKKEDLGDADSAAMQEHQKFINENIRRKVTDAEKIVSGKENGEAKTEDADADSRMKIPDETADGQTNLPGGQTSNRREFQNGEVVSNKEYGGRS